MRNRWEDKGDDQDEPVTITGRELGALKRGASVGFFALILSLVAVGAAGWTIYQGMQGTTTPVLPAAAATQAPAAVDTATAQPASTAPEGTPTASATPTPATEPAAVTAQPSTPTPPARHTVKAVNVASVGHARHGRATASHASSPAPKMESFDPTPAAPSAGVPTQTPIIPTAPVKSASPDTSSHH